MKLLSSFLSRLNMYRNKLITGAIFSDLLTFLKTIPRIEMRNETIREIALSQKQMRLNGNLPHLWLSFQYDDNFIFL